MDAIQTARADLSYSDKPPVIIAASSDAALARALTTVEASGHRVGDRVPIAAAAERIERQVAASAGWNRARRGLRRPARRAPGQG